MTVYEIIMKKRDGLPLTQSEIEFMIGGYSQERIPEYQMAAFLMAIFIRGMNDEEVTALTQAMLHSGDQIDLSAIGKFTVDKHSTGGVGDKVSLILAPLVAALGVPVPMMSGRGLGHTGGTLDKLESIPGFRTDLSEKRFIKQVKEIGLAIIGQTAALAPADKKMYALRDVTATVESIPLIAGSIMSKKLAAGPQGMVFDVKTGIGAFMRTMEQAEQMASTLVQIALRSGRKAVALITDMNQPLGLYAGNSLEIEETVYCLRGRGPEDLMTVTLELAGWMLFFGGKAPDPARGRKMAEETWRSGRGLEKFKEMVAAQNGDTGYVDDPSRFPKASRLIPITAPGSGYLHHLNAFELGLATVALGAGRETTDSPIDHSAGIVFNRKVGARVEAGETVFTIHTNRQGNLSEIESRCRRTLEIKDFPCQANPVIYKVIDSAGVRDYPLRAGQ